MEPIPEKIPNTSRKLFFGLFIFPLLIAVGMAVLLCSVVFLTHEDQTPESLVAAIKTGSAGKRWQKAYELSNELNRSKESLRSQSLLQEIVSILKNPARYDAKTRAYMALAIGRFHGPEAVQALRDALRDPDSEVELYALWSLGRLDAKESAPDLLPILDNAEEDLRKTAAYVLGVLGDRSSAPKLRTLLKDPGAEVRWNAALALARLGDDSGFEILVEMLDRERLSVKPSLSEEAIENVMTNAMKGLVLIQKPESIKILESVRQSDQSMRVRQAAIDAVKDLKEKILENGS